MKLVLLVAALQVPQEGHHRRLVREPGAQRHSIDEQADHALDVGGPAWRPETVTPQQTSVSLV